MKKCTCCGREYSVGIDKCPLDEHLLVSFTPSRTCQTESPAIRESPDLKLQRPRHFVGPRIWQLAAAWLAAGAAAGLAAGPERFKNTYDFLFAAVLFPIGLSHFLPPGTASLGIVWLIYLILTCAALFAKGRKPSRATYVILCILFLLNIVGCHLVSEKIKPGTSIM
jgi:hypothetical protein